VIAVDRLTLAVTLDINYVNIIPLIQLSLCGILNPVMSRGIKDIKIRLTYKNNV